MKGFSQKKGVDFDDIFSPMVKMTSIRVILGLVARLNLEVEQMDVKTDLSDPGLGDISCGTVLCEI